MNNLIQNRRAFIKHASVAAIIAPFLIGCENSTIAQKSESGILRSLKQKALPTGGEFGGRHATFSSPEYGVLW